MAVPTLSMTGFNAFALTCKVFKIGIKNETAWEGMQLTPPKNGLAKKSIVNTLSVRALLLFLKHALYFSKGFLGCLPHRACRFFCIARCQIILTGYAAHLSNSFNPILKKIANQERQQFSRM